MRPLTLERMNKICKLTSRKCLLLIHKDHHKYLRIIGNLTGDICEEKIEMGLKLKFFPSFVEKAYFSNEWKDGDTKTLIYAGWSNTDKLSVTFKINSTVSPSGIRTASFTLESVDIVRKHNDANDTHS